MKVKCRQRNGADGSEYVGVREEQTISLRCGSLRRDRGERVSKFAVGGNC